MGRVISLTNLRSTRGWCNMFSRSWVILRFTMIFLSWMALFFMSNIVNLRFFLLILDDWGFNRWTVLLSWIFFDWWMLGEFWVFMMFTRMWLSLIFLNVRVDLWFFFVFDWSNFICICFHFNVWVLIDFWLFFVLNWLFFCVLVQVDFWLFLMVEWFFLFIVRVFFDFWFLIVLNWSRVMMLSCCLLLYMWVLVNFLLRLLLYWNRMMFLFLLDVFVLINFMFLVILLLMVWFRNLVNLSDFNLFSMLNLFFVVLLFNLFFFLYLLILFSILNFFWMLLNQFSFGERFLSFLNVLTIIFLFLLDLFVVDLRYFWSFWNVFFVLYFVGMMLLYHWLMMDLGYFGSFYLYLFLLLWFVDVMLLHNGLMMCFSYFGSYFLYMFLVFNFVDVMLFLDWLMMCLSNGLIFLMVVFLRMYHFCLFLIYMLNNIDIFLNFENSLLVMTMMFIFFWVVHYMNMLLLVMNTLFSQRFCGFSLIHISIMLIIYVNFVDYRCLNYERLWFGYFLNFLYHNLFWCLFDLFDRLRYLSLNSSLKMKWLSW